MTGIYIQDAMSDGFSMPLKNVKILFPIDKERLETNEFIAVSFEHNNLAISIPNNELLVNCISSAKSLIHKLIETFSRRNLIRFMKNMIEDTTG